jgi:hypothetical protein
LFCTNVQLVDDVPEQVERGRTRSTEEIKVTRIGIDERVD